MKRAGRLLTKSELRAELPRVGVLRVDEYRDHEQSRTLTRARLLEPNAKVERDMLPELLDARMLYVDGGRMRIAGTERLQYADVAQTWDIEVMGCSEQ